MNELLLDTHVFVWYINGDKELISATRKIITDALYDNSVSIAGITLWEIAMLVKKERIILEMPYQEWTNKALELTNISIANLTPAIAGESCQLPGNFHEDPADRMIVATARVENLILVTRDKQMHAYGRGNFISTLVA